MKSAHRLIKAKFENEDDKDKKEMYQKLISSLETQISSENEESDLRNIITKFKDVLSIWLDKQKGKSVNKNEIFFDLPKHFETSYHNDMAALNVKRKLINKLKFKIF